MLLVPLDALENGDIDIKERKVDDRGRISIGRQEYAGKEVKIAVLDVASSEDHEEDGDAE